MTTWTRGTAGLLVGFGVLSGVGGCGDDAPAESPRTAGAAGASGGASGAGGAGGTAGTSKGGGGGSAGKAAAGADAGSVPAVQQVNWDKVATYGLIAGAAVGVGGALYYNCVHEGRCRMIK